MHHILACGPQAHTCKERHAPRTYWLERGGGNARRSQHEADRVDRLLARRDHTSL